MDNTIVQYQEEKKKISELKIKGFEEIDLGKLLATQIWKTLIYSKTNILKRLLALLLCKKYELSIELVKNDDGVFMLNANDGPVRGDNKTIIENGKSFITPCSEINLNKKNIIDVKKIPVKICKTFYYFGKLKGISCFKRLFYAANLVTVDELKHELHGILGKVHFMMMFMDTDLFENYITQCVQKNGGKVAVLQHGQRFYIEEACDSYTGMDNFTADYKMVWSKFSQGQYIKAGFEKKRLPIVGSTKYLYTKTQTNLNPTNLVAIFLDGPMIFNGKESNKCMLKFTMQVLASYGYRCILKPHPLDNLDNYKDIVAEFGCDIANPNDSIEMLSRKINFGIVHTSGVAIDLFILGIPVFVYKDEAIFPIDLPEEFIFENENKFNSCMKSWTENLRTMEELFWKTRENYFEPDPVVLHGKFINSLIRRGE